MPKKYKHIKPYEKEILELKSQGFTRKKIGEKLGFTPEQIHDFTKRYNRNQQKIAEGLVINPRGRPRKDPIQLPPCVQKLSKVKQLQYQLSNKDKYIKKLEMENELMRDFLSLTERK